MKICFFIDDYSAIGGIQRVTAMIASELSKNNDIHVVSMYQENNIRNCDLYDKKIHLAVLKKGPKKYIRQALAIALALRKYIREKDIEAVVATSEMLSPYCVLATVLTDTKFYCWTHTPALNNSEAKLQKIFKHLGVKTADRTICLTEHTKEQLINKYKTDNIAVIPNPIDPKLNLNNKYNKDSKKIISVGRLCYQKNYENLVEVASIVLSKHDDWTWDIYGEGPDKEKIINLIKEKKIENRLNLKNNVNNLYDLYKEYSMQVMTSRYEGFPMTLLEGIANKLPVIAYDVDGVNSMIKTELNGYLIEPYSIEKMAEKICFLIDNTKNRKAFSDADVEEAKKYSIDRVVNKWMETLSLKK